METLPSLFATRPWCDLDPGLLGAAARVPSMLGPEETLFYHWLTATALAAPGDVVDLGCFVGGSTARLASGHAAAGRAGLIHAYDFFTASEPLKRKLLYPAGIPVFEGEGTLPLTRQLLAPWEDRITFHRGDLRKKRWSGDPIALLVVDAAKSVALADHIAAEFFASLIPGRSILVHQDYLHHAQPWLPAQMELLADHFLPLCFVPGASVSFLCLRRPDAAALAAARLAPLSDAALTSLIRANAARLAALCPAEKFARQCASLKARPDTRVAWKFPPSRK